MRTIPGITVINPSDDISAKALLKQAVAYDGPVYMRFGRAPVPVFYDDGADIVMGKGNCVREGNDVAVIASGLMVNEAFMAAEELASSDIDVRIIDMHTVKPIDKDIIVKAAKETGAVVTAEEHSVVGGLGSAVSEVLSENCPIKMRFVGQKDSFGESGQLEELKEKYGMNAAAIVKAVKKIL